MKSIRNGNEEKKGNQIYQTNMKIEGIVSEALPNAQFKVLLDNGITIRCYLAGKLRINKIKVIPGDRVIIEKPNQSDIGRIIYRKR